MNYNDAAALFMKARNKEVGKKIANHTYIVQVGNDYAVKLHATNVVTFKQDGTTVLNSGGYRTQVTKERMNRVLERVQITQERGMWHVVSSNGVKTIYDDNMIIPADGVIVHDAASEDLEKAKKTIDKRVSVYIKNYINHICEHGVEMPGDGDCWPCRMKNADNPNQRDPMGIDHYLSHFDENYFVPALFMNAIIEKGYSNPGMVLHMMESDASFRRSEGTLILQRFFRARKLGLAKELMRHNKVDVDEGRN